MNDKLVKALDREVVQLSQRLEAHAAARRLSDGTIDRAGYARYLTQTYQYVRWTAPLLARGAERLQELGRYPALAELFAVKAREEMGHEDWALADLRALGEDIVAIQLEAPSAAVSAYVAWNSLIVESGSPTAFLGTAYVLESLSIRHGAEVVSNLCRHSAIRRIEGAVSFLRGHAGADVGHMEQLGALLAQVDDERDQVAILLSARVTATLYEGLFDGPYRRRAFSCARTTRFRAPSFT